MTTLSTTPTGGSPAPDQDSARGSLARGMHLLELVAAQPQGVSTIGVLAAESGLDKGTTSRLVKTLEGLGYLARTPSRAVVLTDRLRALGAGAREEEDLAVAARPAMLSASARHGETFHLATANRCRVVYVDSVRPLAETAFASIVGMSADMHVTATGRSILYALPAQESEILVGECLDAPLDPRLAFGWGEFERGRGEADQAGYVRLHREDAVVRVAAAVRDGRGRPVASVAAFSAGGDHDERARALGRACAAIASSLKAS